MKQQRFGSHRSSLGMRTKAAAIVVGAMLALLSSATCEAAGDVQEIALVVKNGKLASGPKVIRLKRDDKVNLRVTADSADEAHVHGYEIVATLLPNQAASLQFVATRTGRFTIELHKSGLELTVLEIYPN